MIDHLFNLLFGCWHRNYSFPQTGSNPASALTGHYVVCLDCGREFPYDWQQMKIISNIHTGILVRKECQ